MGAKRKTVVLPIDTFQKLWKYLVATNPKLAREVRTEVAKLVLKGRPMPESFLEEQRTVVRTSTT